MHCIWSVLENALFQNHCCHEIWVLNPLGSQELNKHSQSTDSPCLHRDVLPLISISLLCLPQRWIAPMVWLCYKVLPSSALLIWGHRLVWHLKAASPALPCIGRASLIPELHECNRDEVLWGLHCTKCRTITVNAKLTLWKLKQRYKGPFWDVSPAFDFKSHWFLTWITQAWE